MSMKSMYPRMMPHRDIKEVCFHPTLELKRGTNTFQLTRKVLEFAKAESQMVLFFATQEAADECVLFATAERQGDKSLLLHELSVRIFDIDVRLYGVFFPAPKRWVMMAFWNHPGLGISSRLAEESLHEVKSNDTPKPSVTQGPAFAILRERIAGLLERAPADPPRKEKVQPGDVYLFQIGMTSIWLSHQCLLRKFNGTSVLFGFAFNSTFHVFSDYGPRYKLLSHGTKEELDQLENHLESQFKDGKKVQAIWCEFPSNPNLATPDLGRLR